MKADKYNPSWREKFSVRSYDIGLNARMRMSSVCSYFQEIADKHASHLDAGYHYMQQTGRVWVLSRMFMTIHRMPDWGQEFYAETWPLGTERIFFRRDYRMDDGHHPLISAASYWLLLDLKTRRPTVFPLNEDILRLNQGRYAMSMPSEAISAVSSENVEIHKVKYSDLDQNHHVNNARYVEWIFDVLDQEVLEKQAPAGFSIEYKHEVKAGDRVELRRDRFDGEGITYLVEGRISGSNQVCIRSKIKYL